jgi:hypothetical protein
MDKHEIISTLKEAQSKGNPVLIQDKFGLNSPIVWIVNICEKENKISFSKRDICNNEVNSIEMSLDRLVQTYPIKILGISISKALNE